MLTLTDIGIIASRLVLETISFYNAKIMYSYSIHISPILTLYITHSFGAVLFLYDIAKHKSNYAKIIKEETGLNFYMFLFHVSYLSLFYNLCHIPKFYSMNCLGDVSIVSIYGASVLCTYIFSIAIMNTKVDASGLSALLTGFVGMVLLLVGDKSLGKYYMLCSWVVGSSIFSGLYGVLYKLAMRYNKQTNTNKTKNNKVKQHNKVRNKNSDGVEELEVVNTKQETAVKDNTKNKRVGNIGDNRTSNNNKNDTENDTENENCYKVDFYENTTQTGTSTVSSTDTSAGQIINKSTKVFKDNINIVNVKQMVKNINEKLINENTNKVVDANTKEIDNVFVSEFTLETKRRLYFMRHYMSLTGLLTFLFYWPGLIFVKYTLDEHMNFSMQLMPLFHLLVAAIVSVSHNLVYFLIVATRTPLFAQISGIILQPTFLFISLVKNHGLSQIYALVGCCMTFASYLMLSDRH